MTTFKFPSLMPPQCEVRESRSGLLRCGGCQVVYHCGGKRDHKGACLATREARTRFSKEETLLRSNPGDGLMLSARVFKEQVGHFWGILGTRDYMRARYGFVEIMLENFPCHQATVQAAVDHIMDMLRLNRSDNMGLRNLVPALMLRLGRDQDAYNFVKWWATCDPHGDYDWGDTELPHLDTRDADAFEEPEWWTRRFLDLSHASTVMLIKLRLLFRLRDLQNTARALQAFTLPREIVDQRVRNQIWALYSAVEAANANFWPLLLAIKHEDLELERPDSYSSGLPEEAKLMALYNYPAWEETPGALDEMDAIWSCQNTRL
ncbi:hypothetical protein F5883DRAFT_695644 [Diaporthe sp. PMI_573]|nr:hypothetical protein F5883DRAFT_695644 [Diaporthaceae sp. PMI_573]